MRVYYLHFDQNNFRHDSTYPWDTNVVDLYNNGQYKNYSLTKSTLGTNLLNNSVWTGMTFHGLGPNYLTDSGRLSDNGTRFIDTSGRIDITAYRINITSQEGTDGIPVYLQVFTAPAIDTPFPEEWTDKSDSLFRGLTLHVGSYRFAKFRLVWNTDQDLSQVKFDLNIRIEIDIPIMGEPMYRKTRNVINKFPEWMAARELENTASATPTLDVPLTTSGKLLNAVAGFLLDDLDSKMTTLRAQQYIDTADVGQIAYVYSTVIKDDPFMPFRIRGDGVDLARAADLEEFYTADAEDDVCYWDERASKIYTRVLYDEFRINQKLLVQSRQHIWNWFDEFGLLMDLYRIDGESNANFKQRILDVYVNPPGVGPDRFKLALRRELNLWKAFDDTATPYSYFQGATPVVLEMDDIRKHPDYVRPDGLPTKKFQALINHLAEKYPTTWGYFQWENTYWDQAGDDFDAYRLAPYEYDATPLDDDHTKSGIGDGPDLYVYRPDVPTGPVQFDLNVKMKGRTRAIQDLYPPIDFDVEIYGTADKFLYENPEVTQWFTLVVDMNRYYNSHLRYDTINPYETPNKFYHSFELSATSSANANHPDPEDPANSNGWSTYQVFMSSKVTAPGLDWYSSDGVFYDGNDPESFAIDLTDFDSIKLYAGKYDPVTHHINDELPSGDHFRVWWSNNPTNQLDSTVGATIEADGFPIIVMNSLDVESGIGRWESEHQKYHITLNNLSPFTSTQDFSMAAPPITWAPNLEEPPNKLLVVKVMTSIPDGVVDDDGNIPVRSVGLSTDKNKDELTMPVFGNIYINDAADWDETDEPDDDKRIGRSFYELSASTPTLVFSSGTTGYYPLTDVPVYTMFQADVLETFEGIVDENGPWRNGEPPPVGNINFNWDYLDLKREDFGVADDTDVVVTWMSVEILNNDQVIAWLDTNTVEPAPEIQAEDDADITYPSNAIEELFDSDTGKYYYATLVPKIRLVDGPDKQWNPKIHSGWFYDRQDEYYLYAQQRTETAATPVFALETVSRQGAPIILTTNEATPQEYRQVAFWDDDLEDMGTTETETVSGTGTVNLYLAYEDVFDVTVTDLGTDTDVTLATSTSTNVIETTVETSRDKLYEVTYKVNRSFVADNMYVDGDGVQRTKLTVVEDTPFNNYVVNYEGSIFNPATPIDLPLNGFYTSIGEGFIYLDYREWGVGTVEVKLSPSQIVADGKDYFLVTIKTFDIHGNPKPNVAIDLGTDFGDLDDTTVTTDRDGFAVTVLESDFSTTTLSGILTVSPDIEGVLTTPQQLPFKIHPITPHPFQLATKTNVEQIPADGESRVSVFGTVRNGILRPIPYANVRWRKGRSVYDIFNKNYQGEVRADSQGRFKIGPFTSEASSPSTEEGPGYWFIATESWYSGATPISGTPNPTHNTAGATPYADLFPYAASPHTGHKVGDVAFWYEYAPSEHGVEDSNSLPRVPIQYREEAENATPYSYYNTYPVTYDDATPYSHATPNTPNWLPPQWYAIDRYKQYQLGLLGTGFYTVDFTKFVYGSHPDYEEY